MLQKTCFVISSIGMKESEIRKHADDLFDLILEPALEKYGFKLSRADKLTTASSITQDIINLVQNSDLCIIDLTGKNPNVMYECGRRHETGKPFIMIAKEGEELPFDITTIRTIFYNIASSRSIRETQVAIQRVVDGLIVEGFSPQSSGESLATISDALRRIERKFDSLSDFKINSSANGENQLLGLKELIEHGLTYYEAYIFSYRNSKYDIAEAALREVLRGVNDPEVNVKHSHLIVEHSVFALRIMEQYILQVKQDFSYDWCSPINSLADAYIFNDLCLEKLKFFDSVVEYFLPHTANNEQKAKIFNCKQKVYCGAGLFSEAIEFGLESIKLWNQNSSFFYNVSISYERGGDLKAALEYALQSLKLNSSSTSTLAKVYKLYIKLGMNSEAQETLYVLKSVNPVKAEVLTAMN